MKLLALFSIIITIIGVRACTAPPIHITEHTISNGNTFACIYESKDDFEQAQMDGIFRNTDIFYTHADGSKEIIKPTTKELKHETH